MDIQWLGHRGAILLSKLPTRALSTPIGMNEEPVQKGLTVSRYFPAPQ